MPKFIIKIHGPTTNKHEYMWSRNCQHSSPLFEAFYKLTWYYKSLDLGCSFINLKYLRISHQFLHRIFWVESSASKYLPRNTKYIEVEAFMTDTGCDIFVVDHPCQFWADATLLLDDSADKVSHTLHTCSKLTWLVTHKRSKWPNDKIRTTSEPLKT